MAASRIVITVSLELTEKEAQWLRALLQNPLSNEPEDKFSRDNRESIFSAIPLLPVQPWTPDQ